MSKDAPISVGKLLSQYLLAVITALPAQEQPSVLSSAEWELAQSQKQLLSETPGLTHDVIWVFVLWLAAVSPCCISPKLDAFITNSKGLMLVNLRILFIWLKSTEEYRLLNSN